MVEMTTWKYYTRNQLARKLGITPEAIRMGESAGRYEPQAMTVDGQPLFAEWYVERIVSDRERKKDRSRNPG